MLIKSLVLSAAQPQSKDYHRLSKPEAEPA
jgi:hypothetical protein